jgi:glycosyltransferase involved in cell wall biosynthesis
MPRYSVFPTAASRRRGPNVNPDVWKTTGAPEGVEGLRVDVEPQRRILIVAYDFPPIASAGMARVVSMVRHLRKRRWEVTVLTVRDSFVRRSDANIELVPDGVTVVRTRSFEAARTAARMRERASLLRADGRVAPALALRVLSQAFGGLARHAAWPDRKAGWFLPLVLGARALLRRDSYDVVLSSSPPHSTHLPMLVLRSLHRFFWVVDFRDPWTTPARGPRFGRIERALERRVLARSDAVIANTPGNKEALLGTFPAISSEKITVITNGFDTDLLAPDGEAGAARLDCDLVYTGHIYPRMLDPFLAALKHLVRSGERAPTVWVYGVRPPHLRIEEELRDFVVFKGAVSFLESVSIMRSAPTLLFLVPHGQGFETWVPSKLYPYLFSGRPIFALVPEGDAARIVEETGAGVAVRSVDPADVACQMRRFLDGARARGRESRRDDPRVAPYAWEALGARLDTLLRAETARS